MSDTRPRLILTLNVGSASLKFAVYRFGPAEERVLAGHLDRVGLPDGRFRAQRGDGTSLEDASVDLPDFEAALTQLLRWLSQHLPDESLAAVGHRVVHGGKSPNSRGSPRRSRARCGHWCRSRRTTYRRPLRSSTRPQ